MVIPEGKPEVAVQLAALIQALAGSAGGIWSTAVLFPIDTLKTLIQTGKTKSNATVDVGGGWRTLEGILLYGCMDIVVCRGGTIRRRENKENCGM